MENKGLYGAVSLCRKAGKLVMGFDAVCEDVFKGKVFLVLTAQDISPKTLNRLQNSIGDLIDIEQMPFSQQELAAVSRKPVAIYGVKDSQLAALCRKHLNTENKEENANAKG